MERQKENAFSDYIQVIKQSWTWNRMTEEEQKRFLDMVIQEYNRNLVIVGTYQHRNRVLNAIYGAYLSGLGYCGGDWREPEKIEPKEQARRNREEYIRTLCNPYPLKNTLHY